MTDDNKRDPGERSADVVNELWALANVYAARKSHPSTLLAGAHIAAAKGIEGVFDTCQEIVDRKDKK